MGLKQAIVVRSDLKMTKGEAIIRVVNASLSATMKTKQVNPEKMDKWLKNGQKKVILKVKNAEELDQIERACLASNIVVVKEKASEDETLPGIVIIAIGIGPDTEKNIDKLTGHLKLL